MNQFLLHSIRNNCYFVWYVIVVMMISQLNLGNCCFLYVDRATAIIVVVAAAIVSLKEELTANSTSFKLI